MVKVKIIIKSILTLALIFGVYTETGIWTALSMFLISYYMEVKNYKEP